MAQITYYHVTESQNVESIMQKGLVPQVGNQTRDRDADIFNRVDAVYVFIYKDDMQKFLDKGVYGDFYYMQNTFVSVFEVTCDDSIFPIKTNWYASTNKVIPPSCLKVIVSEFPVNSIF